MSESRLKAYHFVGSDGEVRTFHARTGSESEKYATAWSMKHGITLKRTNNQRGKRRRKEAPDAR
jgi:hypothetical protein